MNFESPCLNCEKRTVGCHSNCREFTIYKIKREVYRHKRQSQFYKQNPFPTEGSRKRNFKSIRTYHGYGKRQKKSLSN